VFDDVRQALIWLHRWRVRNASVGLDIRAIRRIDILINVGVSPLGNGCGRLT
jgi:hypothetical protein